MEHKMFAYKICSKSNKNVPYGTKHFRKQNCIQNLWFSCLFSRPCIAFCDFSWPFHGLVRPSYGAFWPFMAKYLFDWTGILFSRGHRSKFICSCFKQQIELRIYLSDITDMNKCNGPFYREQLSMVLTQVFCR